MCSMRFIGFAVCGVRRTCAQMLRNFPGCAAVSPSHVRLKGEPPGLISAALPARVFNFPSLELQAPEYAGGQEPDQEQHPHDQNGT
jgi:hypothetical protein